MTVWLRRVSRLAQMIFLLLLGLTITFVIFPFGDRAAHRRWIQWWSGALVRACGVRVQVHKTGLAQPDGADEALASPDSVQQRGYLILANHLSWLDIFVINQFAAARFVAKSEIAAWPMVGMLVRRTGTLFIERGRRRAVHSVLHEVADHLRGGDLVAVFPEGMISPGDALLPFHGNLIQAAISAGSPMLPIGLQYTDLHNKPSQATRYYGNVSFVRSVWQILGEPQLVAHLHLLDAIEPVAGDKRHELAARARLAIANRLDLAMVDSPPEIPGGRST